MIKDRCSWRWRLNEVCMALPIFYGHSPTFLKYALHHLSPEGHLLVPCKSKPYRLSSRLCCFLALKYEPHYLPSEWCRFTSCLWNLDDVNFLQNDNRSCIWNRCRITSLLWACSCNVEFLVACSDIFKVLLAFPCIFKVLIGTPCIFNILLAFLKSWCLATMLCTLDVWAMLSLKIGVVVALL